MITVKFLTESAIFYFDYESVRYHLEQRISDHNLPGNRRQLELLSNTTEDIIEIDQDDNSFGFVILELVKSGIGRVTCKRCDKIYSSKDLELFALGAGNSPLRPNIEINRLRNLFRHRKRNPSLLGGKGYRCPAGHELIRMITWRT